MYKTVFFGNSQFCMPTLQMVYETTTLLAIVTGEDKTVTQRSHSVMEPLPKVFGKQHDIPVFQPHSLKEEQFIQQLTHLKPDIMIILSYGKILPQEIFTIPALGTFNLHASILPKYRGASPLQESLLHNDRESGITLQKINHKVDEGAILLKTPYSIPEDELFPSFYQNMSLCAAETWNNFIVYTQTNKSMPPLQQQMGDPSFCKKISKKDGYVSFSELTAQEIYNRYRAYYSWPQIFTTIRDKSVKIEELQMVYSDQQETNYLPGTVVQADKKGFTIQTKQGQLSLSRLKPENKNTQDAFSFINGYKIRVGEFLC